MDAVMMVESTKECNLANAVDHVPDGDEALDYLFQRGKYETQQRPGLIFLDLNLPGTDGFGVLKQIKEDEALKTIPVCILTSSELEEDILRSYKMHANAFIPKPISPDGFTDAFKAVKDFWSGIVAMPPTGH